MEEPKANIDPIAAIRIPFEGENPRDDPQQASQHEKQDFLKNSTRREVWTRRSKIREHQEGEFKKERGRRETRRGEPKEERRQKGSLTWRWKPRKAARARDEGRSTSKGGNPRKREDITKEKPTRDTQRWGKVKNRLHQLEAKKQPTMHISRQVFFFSKLYVRERERKKSILRTLWFLKAGFFFFWVMVWGIWGD